MSPTLPHRLANGRTRDAFEIAAAGRIGTNLPNDVRLHHLWNARFGFALPSFAPADIATRSTRWPRRCVPRHPWSRPQREADSGRVTLDPVTSR